MTLDEDAIRWAEYHNLEILEKDNIQYVKINNPCSKLKGNLCSIYKDRPEVCKMYLCKK